MQQAQCELPMRTFSLSQLEGLKINRTNFVVKKEIKSKKKKNRGEKERKKEVKKKSLYFVFGNLLNCHELINTILSIRFA